MRNVQVGQRIENPAWAVKVTHQQPTGIPELKRVKAGMDVAAQVSPDGLVAVGKVLSVGPVTVSPTTSDGGAPS